MQNGDNQSSHRSRHPAREHSILVCAAEAWLFGNPASDFATSSAIERVKQPVDHGLIGAICYVIRLL
jgi:hypothetical protein